MYKLVFTRRDVSGPMTQEEARKEMMALYHHYGVEGNVWDENEPDFIELGTFDDDSAVVKYADGTEFRWEVVETK